MARSDKQEPMTLLGEQIAEQLRQQGVDPETLCCSDSEGTRVKVVCVPATLRDSVEGLGRSTRDQVLMVRIDEETVRKLDAWVHTGAVRSRSQAAALFIREGLAVRDGELTTLRDAIRDVEVARQHLQDRAREVLGARDRNE